MLFKPDFTKPLIEHGSRLHDHYFLPTLLWEDFETVLGDLKKAGFAFDPETFRAIWNWRFPQMLVFENEKAHLAVRKAHEGWPLLCETPPRGRHHQPIRRYLHRAPRICRRQENRPLASHLRAGARELPLQKFPGNRFGAGLRYRRSAWYPSLHPGIPMQVPLFVTILRGRELYSYKLDQDRRNFVPVDFDPHFAKRGAPCKKLRPELLTYDLRLP